MRRLALPLLLLAALAGAAWATAAERLPARDPLIVSATLRPLVAGFGDPVTAEVRVLIDPVRVDADSLRLRTTFAPWREERRIERRQLDRLVQLTYTLTLTCHGIPCVEEDERQWHYDLSDAHLRYLEAGAERSKSIAWPQLAVFTRLPQGFEPPDEEGDDSPVWRAAVDVPAPSFRAEPQFLQGALVVAGVLLLGGAAALVVLALRAPRAPKEVPPLERALAQLARARTAAERRAALEAVAVELHPALAAAARELAWSERAPTEPAARQLSERVREVAR